MLIHISIMIMAMAMLFKLYVYPYTRHNFDDLKPTFEHGWQSFIGVLAIRLYIALITKFSGDKALIKCSTFANAIDFTLFQYRETMMGNTHISMWDYNNQFEDIKTK